VLNRNKAGDRKAQAAVRSADLLGADLRIGLRSPAASQVNPDQKGSSYRWQKEQRTKNAKTGNLPAQRTCPKIWNERRTGS